MPDKKDQRLFNENIVPAKAGSDRLFDVDYEAGGGGPVECLGKTFASEDERREYFREKLREKLQDPEFRNIEGFPIGSDADILALSDPPYYTACPNPWLADFVREWQGEPQMNTDEHGSKDDNLCASVSIRGSSSYHREPFAVDVSEGKTHAIYKAHSYHTKVPHLAIVPSILHYTEPGDVVLDGFAGSGMTGIAAQWCGTAPPDYRAKLEQQWKAEGHPPPEWGVRRCVLNDLSPAATFIAANYNLPFDVAEFARAAKQLLEETADEIGWMYETYHVEQASSLSIDKLYEAAVQRGYIPPDTVIVDRQERDLPHWHYQGAIMFVTFHAYGGVQLSEPARDVVLNAVKHYHGSKINLYSAVVMPDHAHMLFQLVEGDLTSLMHSIKSFSSNQANRVMERSGILWQNESYDRIVRDDKEFFNVSNYIWRNPEKAGLVEHARDYSWLWVSEEMRDAGWKPAPLARIEYTVWSEVFACPECAGEVVFLDEALDPETKRVKDSFPCPHCNSEVGKRSLDKTYETVFDRATGTTLEIPRRRPSMICYRIGKAKYEKKPDAADLAILARVAELDLPAEMPTAELPYMHMTHERARMDRAGITHIHHFFLPRAAQALGTLWRKAKAHPDPRVRHMLTFLLDQSIWGFSILNRYGPTHFSQVNRQMTGVYYVPSQTSECSPWYNLDGKASRLPKAFRQQPAICGGAAVGTGSTAGLQLPDTCIDYIFTDPPFGENIYYADLNYLVESWYGVFSNAQSEAIVDKAKKKGLPEYQELMRQCFAEYYRVLKPGRWITIVFHNSRNTVWNAIQEALQSVGFVVADVRTLDKQQGSYRQVTSTAVKQDLVISAYRPNGGLEERFQLVAGTEDGAWEFVRTHLKQLPTFVSKDNRAEVIAERLGYLLYDRMVAFHVQRGVTVPLDSADFAAGIAQRFVERDGMYFLPDQVAEYDRKRMTAGEIKQLELFVTDETSAIQWLRQQLTIKPQTFQELHPQFLKEIGGWGKHETPLELSVLLDQNFLCNTTDRWYVPDPNKAGDLEKLRERGLLREFDQYKQRKKKFGRSERFRMEAVRAGFKKAWQDRDYGTIIAVAELIPESILQEDPKLLMWYDQAITRSEG